MCFGPGLCDGCIFEWVRPPRVDLRPCCSNAERYLYVILVRPFWDKHIDYWRR